MTDQAKAGADDHAPAVDAKNLTIGHILADGTASPVLSGLDLTVKRGEFLTILGPSGCGKSTLLRVIADLLPPLDGGIAVLGRTPSEARRRREVAFVFQDATLLPWRTVRQNVELPLQIGRANVARQVAEVPSDVWIDLVGLGAYTARYPHQLSGGQRQRVAIARALQSEPEILLMDEPFGALDEITRERLNDELLAVWRRTGATIVFVTHSIMEAVTLGGRVLVLASDPGRVQALVDIAALKDADGRCRREAPDVIETATRLRALLQDGATAE
jgi:NitT/TauT family transport system ATP-binding protein